MATKKTDPVTIEKETENEAEAMAHHAGEPTIDELKNNPDVEAEKALIVEEGADADQVVPAEVAAIHEDNESARAASGSKAAAKGKSNTTAVPKPKKSRSASYLKAKAEVEKGKLYQLDEALLLVKKISLSKFDGAMELHLKLTKKKSKGSTESSKGIFHLPNGSGKERKIIILDEAKIEEIAKTKKIDFDIAIATPELMPKVGKIAKILGPRGLMPDPKSGTVTNDPEKTIAEINSGKVEYRIDASNNIHQMIGRVSWDETKLKENVQAVLAAFPKSRVAAGYVSASISPSVPLDLTSL